MIRRDFMRLGALGLLTLTPLASIAMSKHHQGSGVDLKIRQLPEHLPLRQLPEIENLASGNVFKARLSVAATPVELTGPEKTQLWLYNNQITPLIQVTEGDHVEVQVDNHLHQPTTVHWHGLKVPNSEDGGPHDLIAPHQSRTYRFQVKPGDAGLHWFHPHPHAYLADQIAHSMAAAFLVKPYQDPMPALPSYLLMVTDLRLDAQGQVAPHTHVDWVNGREGDILLVNGQRNPKLELAPGSTLRLRMINACAGRYLRLALDKHTIQLIGTDGGYLEQPVELEELLLVPGQRCDMLIKLSHEPNQSFALQTLPYDRDWMGPRPAHYLTTETLMTLATNAATRAPAIALPQRLTEIKPLAEAEVHRLLELSEVMPGHAMSSMGHNQESTTSPQGHGGHSMHGNQGQHSPAGIMTGRPPIEFLINGESFTPGRIMFTGKVGQLEEWEVFNNSHMDHPFHIHGTHFQVVAEQDAAGAWQIPAYRAWRDTVNLLPNQRLKLRLVFNEPGEWMFHCHIIEHEELGMMASILVQ
ncbi:multicopper oxidase family protein [Nitrincola sp. A-D6]|uniref:multicopper oxidase family protein n=1 Tax=Nitrincola sp. A-D6 TaxID=1545442 RepID=UPI00068A8388|nr:multicopper oxidase family protein [Nitrincola sp. A-D6]